MNRYSLFAAVLISVMILFIVFDIDDNEIEIVGYADDIHQTENGFVFTIMDKDGNQIKAFTRSEIDDSLHSFRGNYSDDGGIFFIDSVG